MIQGLTITGPSYNWLDRHPFRKGNTIRPRAQQIHAAPLTVTMLGEDAFGPWIAVNGGWQYLDACLYELVPDQSQKKASA